MVSSSLDILSCISTGGPATTVTWTRDSVTITEGTETVLTDRNTAQYEHILTLTERLGGLYTCTVANNKPSSDSASINLPGVLWLTHSTEPVYYYIVAFHYFYVYTELYIRYSVYDT